MGDSGLGYLWRYLRATARILRDPRRYHLLRSAVAQLDFLPRDVLPVARLGELWPEIEQIQARITIPSLTHHFELPYFERTILASIASHLKPRLVFEFGTFTGTTTRILAEETGDDALVHTIDLPVGSGNWEPWVAEAVGSAFADVPQALRAKIVSHRCDTRTFDYSALKRRVDLVFIDASHEYRDVLHDSERALEMISDRGVVVWDDYQPRTPGVVRALNELRQRVPVTRIAQSRLVVHQKSPNQNPGRRNFHERTDPLAPRIRAGGPALGVGSGA